MAEPLHKVGGHVHTVGSKAMTQIATLIISAFGLVAALAWNTAIQGAFTLIFGKNNDIAAMFAYAITVTVVAVIVTLYLSRINGK